MKRALLTTAPLVLIIALIFACFGTGWSCTVPSWLMPPTAGPGLDRIEQAWNVIINDFVDRDNLDVDALSETAIDALINALGDPYSAYLDAEEYELSKQSLEGSYGGIGAEMTLDDEGRLTVVAPIVGTPAMDAGIRPGDRVLAIDGDSTEGMKLIEAVVRIRGEPGTRITLSVQHKGEESAEDIEITRQEIEVTSVFAKMLDDDIAHIQLHYFSRTTGDDMVSALENIVAADARGIILDLRDNPGGILRTAVTVASQFIAEGVVAYAVDGEGNRQELSVEEGGLATDLPLAVLVNANSASASEVVAGAIQDHERGLLIGNTTLGKGRINTFRELKDGSAIYITIARWYTPDDRQIEGVGIIPDEIIEITQEDINQGRDPQLERAIEYVKGQA